MLPTDSPGLLSQALADQYATRWATVVAQADPADLQRAFRVLDEKGQPLALPYVSLPIAQVVRLVSTLGVQAIKARFLLVPQPDKTERFALALSAADGLGARASSFYLADNQYPRLHTAVEPPRATDLERRLAATEPLPGAAKQVAHALAKSWLEAWAKVGRAGGPPVTPDLFATPYGPLRGYTFEMADFLAPLFRVAAFGQQELRIYFGLHDYYRTEPDGQDKLVQTFSMAVRLWNPPTGKEEMAGSSEPIYDMSMPIPPGH